MTETKWRQWVLDRLAAQHEHQWDATPLEYLRESLEMACNEGALRDATPAIFRGVTASGRRFVFGWVGYGVLWDEEGQRYWLDETSAPERARREGRRLWHHGFVFEGDGPPEDA